MKLIITFKKSAEGGYLDNALTSGLFLNDFDCKSWYQIFSRQGKYF